MLFHNWGGLQAQRIGRTPWIRRERCLDTPSSRLHQIALSQFTILKHPPSLASVLLVRRLPYRSIVMDYQGAPTTIMDAPTESCKDRHFQQQRVAISLSNSAVVFMERAEYNAAIGTLSHSLKFCNIIMDEAHDFSAPMTATLDGCMEASRSSHGGTRLHTGERYLYQQAVRIPLDMGSSYHSCVMISTLVTFNLALAYQLNGTSKATNPTEVPIMLRKAAKLYELAFGMQQAEGFDNNTLFTLATVNNLGLIHSQLNDRPAADQCFEYLLSTLMYLTDCSKGSDLFDEFFCNASALTPNSESAPAA